MARPTREEWARRQRTLYIGDGDGPPEVRAVSRKLSDYATPEEIATVIAELERRYRGLLKDVMQAKKRAEPWLQRKGEDSRAWYRRLPWDQKEFCTYEEIKRRRSEIKETLALL